MHVHVQVLRICNYAVGVLCVRGRAIAATSIATYAIATTSAIATAVIATAVTASVTTGTGDSKPTAASKPAAVAYSIAARAARTRGNASPPSPHTATRPDATVRSGRRPDAEPGTVYATALCKTMCKTRQRGALCHVECTFLR